MRFEFIKGNDLKKSIKSLNEMEVDDKTYNIPMYKDFSYFSPVDLESDGSNFFIAVDEEINEIVGVLKIKRYTKDTYKYIPEEEIWNQIFVNKMCIGVKFLDVREDYQRRGIATELIKQMCNMVNKEVDLKTKIELSFLTKAGSKAKLDKIFKKYIKGLKVNIIK